MLKRFFDIAFAATGLVLSAPLWMVLAVLVKWQDGGPIFIAQERVGRGGRIFRAYKFRSMVRDAEATTGPVQAISDDPRVTPLGRWLRATAMDELPQLFNILRGDMSVVGPRALRPDERLVIGDQSVRLQDVAGFERRHQVRPGLTGLAQVHAPRDVMLTTKFRYDLLYVKRRSFCLDLRLIVMSFAVSALGRWERSERLPRRLPL